MAQIYQSNLTEKIIRCGDDVFPPPFEQTNDIVLILANHLSDADDKLVTANLEYYDEKPVKTKYIGFTYESFQYLPGVGKFIGRKFLGLRKGDDPENLVFNIQWFENNYNTWLLFPEGTLFSEASYAKSLSYQRGLKISEDKLLHHVLYPREGALTAFLQAVGHRLKYIVYLTFEYQDYNPRKTVHSYINNPGAFHG